MAKISKIFRIDLDTWQRFQEKLKGEKRTANSKLAELVEEYLLSGDRTESESQTQSIAHLMAHVERLEGEIKELQEEFAHRDTQIGKLSEMVLGLAHKPPELQPEPEYIAETLELIASTGKKSRTKPKGF